MLPACKLYVTPITSRTLRIHLRLRIGGLAVFRVASIVAWVRCRVHEALLTGLQAGNKVAASFTFVFVFRFIALEVALGCILRLPTALSDNIAL
jgi:hypothetical protein